jgi:hypothetical protein
VCSPVLHSRSIGEHKNRQRLGILLLRRVKYIRNQRATRYSRPAVPPSCRADKGHQFCWRSIVCQELPPTRAVTSRKPASWASTSISAGVKKLMNGAPLARAPSGRSFHSGTNFRVHQLNGQQERHDKGRVGRKRRDPPQRSLDCLFR